MRNLLCILALLGVGGAYAQTDARVELKGQIGGYISQAWKQKIGQDIYYAIVRTISAEMPWQIDLLRANYIDGEIFDFTHLAQRLVDWTGQPPSMIRILDLNGHGRLELSYKVNTCGNATCSREVALQDTGYYQGGPRPEMSSTAYLSNRTAAKN